MAGSNSNRSETTSAEQSADTDENEIARSKSQRRLLIGGSRALVNPVPSGAWVYLFYKLDRLWYSFLSAKVVVAAGVLFVMVFVISMILYYVWLHMERLDQSRPVVRIPRSIVPGQNLNFFTPAQGKNPILRSVDDAQAAAQATPMVSPAAAK